MTILYVLLAILIFGILIFIHELGHFLVAKAFGVTVNEFAIGMGPKLISFCPGKKKKKKEEERLEAASEHSEAEENREEEAKQSDPSETSADPDEIEVWKDFGRTKEGNTVYSLRAFPIGGFVSMEGEDGESDDPNAYSKKSAWKRILISLAGPVMNLVLGFILMFILVSNTPFVTPFISYDHEGENSEKVYPSEEAGLRTDDKIIQVGSVSVHTGHEVYYEILHQGFEAVDITVEREVDGKKVELVFEKVVFQTTVDSNIMIGVQDFQLYAYAADADFITLGDRLSAAFYRGCSTVKMVWDSVLDLFSGRYGVEAVSGPIGVTTVITDAAKTGVLDLLYIVTVITINLGVMNLMPFPALDGAHVITYFIEMIVRKPLPKKIEGIINLAGLAILMLFMLFISAKDLLGLFS